MILNEFEHLFNESNICVSILKDESMKKHTTMNVGGNAKLFIEPHDLDGLKFALLNAYRLNIPFFLLGGGSNVIVNDKGLDLVITTKKINDIKLNDNFLEIESGASWAKVLTFCEKNDLSGFESFTGLSGTIGGALYMNASCFNLATSDNLLKAEYLDLKTQKVHTYTKNTNDWNYKKSPFQNEKEKIILKATFKVSKGFDKTLSQKTLNSRIEKGHFRSKSAGSAFKNIPAQNIIAAKLIDESGLKGLTIGAAQIAPFHANFIINPTGKATANDIKELVQKVQKTVQAKTGILLESEILFI